MTTFEALVLGVVQGVTEFLPISSTAHLRIVPALAGWGDPAPAFTAVLQLGTLVAVVGYFLPDLLKMCAGGDQRGDRSIAAARATARQLGYLIVGHAAGRRRGHRVQARDRRIAALAVGHLDRADRRRAGAGLVDTPARHSRGFDDIRLRDALIIGCAQALALVPGVSRRGSPWSRRWRSACGATPRRGFRSCSACRRSARPESSSCRRSCAHTTSAAARSRSGWSRRRSRIRSIAWLLRFLRARSTIPFAVYRIALGIVLLWMLATGRLL
jgi:undecaprenyl-diphosphatase